MEQPEKPKKPGLSIHGHAIRRYMKRVNAHKGEARVALFHMWQIGSEATDHQLALMHRSRRPGEVYRISECCYGKYLIVLHTSINQIRTLWKIG